MKAGKRRDESLKGIDSSRQYDLSEACDLVKSLSFAKFDESVDIAVRLGVNPKHADQVVRGAVVLPHGIGKERRIAVFAKGERAAEAEQAGADFVGSDDLVAKVSDGFLDFDVAIATPDMMGAVGRLGRVLGPRGLMPNPKVGTVTVNVSQAVQDAKAGKVEFRVDKGGVVHAPIGKRSFDGSRLIDNAKSLVGALVKAKPPGAKGTYLRSITLSSTMGAGISVDSGSLLSKEAT